MPSFERKSFPSSPGWRGDGRDDDAATPFAACLRACKTRGVRCSVAKVTTRVSPSLVRDGAHRCCDNGQRGINLLRRACAKS